MSGEQEPPRIAIPHPSPHRNRVGLIALFFGLSAAAFAWDAQLVISSALVGHACYPRDMPLSAPLWTGVWGWLLAISCASIALTIAGGLMSWRNLRRTKHEAEGSVHHLLAIGEGRTRFMAMFGILASFLFGVGIIFATAAMMVVPLCH